MTNYERRIIRIYRFGHHRGGILDFHRNPIRKKVDKKTVTGLSYG